ncbi:MAG: DUF433 domain-containing protein [Fimbriimonadaceae bacterium]
MTIPVELQDVREAQPEIISGAARCKGTRARVQALIDALVYGDSVEGFLEGWLGFGRASRRRWVDNPEQHTCS